MRAKYTEEIRKMERTIVEMEVTHIHNSSTIYLLSYPLLPSLPSLPFFPSLRSLLVHPALSHMIIRMVNCTRTYSQRMLHNLMICVQQKSGIHSEVCCRYSVACKALCDMLSP